MSPFYNPYMKTPDWGSGIQDIVGQLMQIMMMNKMFPQSKTTETPEMGPQGMPMPRHGMAMQAGAQPQAGGQPPTGGPPMTAQLLQGAAPSGMPPTGGPPQMDPQMMQMLMQMLMQGGIGR